MEFAFPWPYSQGEWLAWIAAAVTVLVGLLFLLAPRFALGLLRPDVSAGDAAMAAEGRAMIGGFYAGFGLCAILFAQPLIYMTLGFAWAAAAFGRVVVILSGPRGAPANWLLLLASLVLAALPLAFAIGIVP